MREQVLRGRKLRLLVPEDRQRNQRYRDDPQDNVFAAVLFFCHKREYSIPQSLTQLQRCFSRLSNGLAGSCGVRSRSPLVTGELDNLPQMHRIDA